MKEVQYSDIEAARRKRKRRLTYYPSTKTKTFALPRELRTLIVTPAQTKAA